MEIREKLGRIIEPPLWNNPPIGSRVIGCSPSSDIEGLKICVLKKADRLIESGLIKETL